jgi:hypothetical protein
LRFALDSYHPERLSVSTGLPAKKQPAQAAYNDSPCPSSCFSARSLGLQAFEVYIQLLNSIQRPTFQKKSVCDMPFGCLTDGSDKNLVYFGLVNTRNEHSFKDRLG